MPRTLICVVLMLLLGGALSCEGGTVSPRRQDGAVTKDGGGQQGDGSGKGKLGDDCIADSCGDNLLCLIGTCHQICSTGCGEKAPECQENEGCHEQTSFSSACIAGTAKAGEDCGGLTFCLPGALCVELPSLGKTICLPLCKNESCTGTSTCQALTSGCKVCVPK